MKIYSIKRLSAYYFTIAIKITSRNKVFTIIPVGSYVRINKIVVN